MKGKPAVYYISMKRGSTLKVVGIVVVLGVVAVLMLRTPNMDTAIAPAEQYVGTAEEGCAPWDGAAVSLSLSPQKETPFPSVYVNLWTHEFPSSLSFDEDDESMSEGGGYVSYCSQEKECEKAQKAKIKFNDTGDIVTGTFVLVLQDGQKMKGSYKATWDHTIMALCG